MKADPVLEQLAECGLKRSSPHEPMSRYTSWRIGGPADYFCVAETLQQMRAAVSVASQHGLPWLVMGGGNNVLVSDDGIEGMVILNRLRGIEIVGGDQPTVECGAGVFFARIAQYTAQRGYTGMEWGIAIPGTVGGGVVNNAGAHGSEVATALLSVDVLDATGTAETLSPQDLAYRYRKSKFKGPHATHSTVIVTAARFRLAHGDAEAALRAIAELRDHRLATQPVKEASAGSTFTNPEGDHAGALIERAGLKGHRIGGAQISPLHANFILNVEGATASDVVALVRLAQDTVLEKYGIRLHPEIQFVGRWDERIVRSVMDTPA